MKKGMKFKRRRLGITDYKKRLSLLLSNKPRLVVRKTLNNIIAEIVEYKDGKDFVKIYVDVPMLKKKFGWKGHANTPAAYLVGYYIGKLALKNNIEEAVLDIGRISKKSSKVFAVLKGAVDAGLNVPHNEEILPSEERIKGKHIEEFAKIAKEPIFNNYKKNGLDPSKISQHFEEILKKIEEV